MPVHPSEEETSSHVFDSVAKDSKDSTASDHPIHDTRHVEKEDPKAAVNPHKSKGPQIVDG